jgi:hypothetical protein
VAPVQIEMNRAVGIVLIEKMILTVPVNDAVRIVHPIGGRQKMKLWTLKVIIK